MDKVRFGVFEADLRAGELRKHGVRIHLQRQPFKILAALIERPGDLVTREDLRELIWGSETVVDFDHSTWASSLRYASGGLISAPQSVADKWSTYTFASGTPMVRVPGVPLYLINVDCRCINPNNINQRVLNPAAWQDVAAGTISPGSGYYNDYRGTHQVSENMNFGRTFQIREKMSLNLRAEFFNMFNRVTLGTPSSSNPLQTTTVNSATGAISGFGYYSIGSTSSAGSPRVGLLVPRFQF